jgi:UDP-N-acetylglucosamine 4,6-dehydratase
MSEDEARSAVELDDFFVIKPLHVWWGAGNWSEGTPVAAGFRYNSDTNKQWLTSEQICNLVGIPATAAAACR